MPKNQPDQFIRFERTPACDRRTDRHRVIAYIALCVCIAYADQSDADDVHDAADLLLVRLHSVKGLD